MNSWIVILNLHKFQRNSLIDQLNCLGSQELRIRNVTKNGE